MFETKKAMAMPKTKPKTKPRNPRMTHVTSTGPWQKIVETPRDAPMLATPTPTRKLDLACGQNPIPGFEGVDIWSGAQHVVNLMRYPWPFEDGSVAELHCSHFCEHVPTIYVDEAGYEVQPADLLADTRTHGAKDALLKFFEECERILVPGGTMKVVVPSGKNNRAFQDPTHRRFFVPEVFGYLSADWRKSVGLDHYNTSVDFIVQNVATTCDEFYNTLDPAVSTRRFAAEWNAAVDYHATLIKKGSR